MHSRALVNHLSLGIVVYLAGVTQIILSLPHPDLALINNANILDFDPIKLNPSANSYSSGGMLKY